MTSTRAKAKDLSKWGIAIGTVLVVSLSCVRGFFPYCTGREFGLSMVDILELGGFCVATWSPVYISLWIDKFTGRTQEGACGSQKSD